MARFSRLVVVLASRSGIRTCPPKERFLYHPKKTADERSQWQADHEDDERTSKAPEGRACQAEDERRDKQYSRPQTIRDLERHSAPRLLERRRYAYRLCAQLRSKSGTCSPPTRKGSGALAGFPAPTGWPKTLPSGIGLKRSRAIANPGQIVGWVTVSDWGNVAAYVAPEFRGKTGSGRLSDIRTVFPTIVHDFQAKTGRKAKGVAFQWNRRSTRLTGHYLKVRWPLAIRVYWGTK